MKKQLYTAANLALALEFARKGKNRKAAKYLLAATSTPDAAWPFPTSSIEKRFHLVQDQLQRIRAAVDELQDDLSLLRSTVRVRYFLAGLDDYELDDEDGFQDELDDDFDLSEFQVGDEYFIDDAGHGLTSADADDTLGDAGEEEGVEADEALAQPKTKTARSRGKKG